MRRMRKSGTDKMKIGCGWGCITRVYMREMNRVLVWRVDESGIDGMKAGYR